VAIGAAYTAFPGKTVDDYLTALRQRTTQAVFVRRPNIRRSARLSTTRRSMTTPSWMGNLWREFRSEDEKERWTG
jgi:hypothetical protein